MRRVFGAALAVLFVGCGGSNDSHVANPDFTGKYTLQGTIMNAVTGERLGGNDLKLVLVQGSDIRDPSRLTTDAKDPLVGEYAFTGIPADLNPAGAIPNKTFKVVAIKPGFQRFEGEISFQVAGSATLDATYNKIGNIYLFPVGATAPSCSFTVQANGKPVPNATVYFQPGAEENGVSIFQPSPNTLAATPGYLPALTATTDASGHVTFAGSQLALGAVYQVVVAPVTFEGVQLQQVFGPVYFVGFDNVDAVLPMSDLVPGGNPFGLYVEHASTDVAAQVEASGALTIVFSRPVALVNPNAFAAVAASTTGVLATAQPVIAALSADGLTLTLTPNWQTQPGGADRGVTVTYGNGTAALSVVGYPSATFSLFSLAKASGGSVNGTVVLRAP